MKQLKIYPTIPRIYKRTFLVRGVKTLKGREIQSILTSDIKYSVDRVVIKLSQPEIISNTQDSADILMRELQKNQILNRDTVYLPKMMSTHKMLLHGVPPQFDVSHINDINKNGFTV